MSVSMLLVPVSKTDVDGGVFSATDVARRVAVDPGPSITLPAAPISPSVSPRNVVGRPFDLSLKRLWLARVESGSAS